MPTVYGVIYISDSFQKFMAFNKFLLESPKEKKKNTCKTKTLEFPCFHYICMRLNWPREESTSWETRDRKAPCSTD
jgi:hypothetical protein